MKKNYFKIQEILTVISIFLFSNMPASWSQNLEEGLVGYWSFDEGNGDIAHDYSGNGNDGTIYGATWIRGVSCNALDFDGIDDFVKVSNPINLNFGLYTDFSFSAWIKARTLQRIYPAIIGRRNPPASNGYIFFIYCDNNVEGNLAVQLNDGKYTNYLSLSQDLRDNRWHHVLATGDRDGYLTFYVDSEKQQGCYNISNKGNIDSSSNLFIGWEERNPNVTYFNGIIDEVRIYNRALDEDEILDLYTDFAGIVSNINSVQRIDAGKLVDMYYTLSGEIESCTITAQISNDGGENWSIIPTTVYGDVGAGITPGFEKHIEWDPTVDIPGESGTQYMVRLTVDDSYYADSNVFEINAAGPGHLGGTVYHMNTGKPISGASVSIPNQPSVQTGSEGDFLFTNIQSGQIPIEVSKEGFITATEIAKVYESSVTDKIIGLAPNNIVGADIARVQGRYCGPGNYAYFLDGVSFIETFRASVIWGTHTPGIVKWVTPKEIFEDPCSGSTVERSFNMGEDFGVGGNLKVFATTGDYPPVEFGPYHVQFDVLPKPALINLIPSIMYQVYPTGRGFEYRIKGLGNAEIDLALWDGTQVEQNFPLFGGRNMKVGMKFGEEVDPHTARNPITAMLYGTVNSDGKASLFAIGWDGREKTILRKGIKCVKGIKLPYFEASPSVTFEQNFYWSKERKKWMNGGMVDLGCDLKWSSPQVPVSPPIYIRFEIELGLDLLLGVEGWSNVGPRWAGSFEFEPIFKAIGGAGLASVICVEVYGGGGFHSKVAFIPELTWLDTYIIVLLGVRADLGPFSSPELELRYTWPEGGKLGSGFDDKMRSNRWALMPRNYLSYSSFPSKPPTPLSGGSEAPIEENIFPDPVANSHNI